MRIMKLLLYFLPSTVIFPFVSYAAPAPKERNILVTDTDNISLDGCLAGDDSWHGFPMYSDRLHPLISKRLKQEVIFISQLDQQQGKGWKASEYLVKRLSESRAGVNYYEEKVPFYTLPAPLRSKAGDIIRNRHYWMKIRRPELLGLFRENIYGKLPGTTYRKSFRVVHTDRYAMHGAATLKQVDINIEAGGKALTINLTMFVPNNIQKAAPVFLLINNRDTSNTDPTRKVKSEFWPAEEVVSRGYAIAAFSNADVDPDNFDGFENGIHGILDQGERGDDAWGSIAAWAWGAGRCMDYLETDPDINSKQVAVVGHSRGGKTALWAGAEDERFALVVSNESGCGGAALARRKYGETVSMINNSFPHWFCLNYRKYNDNEDSLPVDMHELMALIAPRALYVASASDDLWADPKGSYLALFNSLPVFRLFDSDNNIPESVPALGKPVFTKNVAYHIRAGEHDLKLEDWQHFMDFSDSLWRLMK